MKWDVKIVFDPLRVFAKLDDYPPGYTKYFLRKQLIGRDSS
jgi:hypothetical protein